MRKTRRTRVEEHEEEEEEEEEEDKTSSEREFQWLDPYGTALLSPPATHPICAYTV